MEITVNIKAPELVAAVNTLAAALESWNHGQITSMCKPVQAATPVQPQVAMPSAVQAPAAQPGTLAASLPGQQIPLTPAQPVYYQQPAAQQPIYPQQPTQQPAQPQPTPSVPTNAPAPVMGAAVPTAAQTYSPEQLAVAATQLVDAGRRAELVNLLASFGVQALTALPKEQYGNFATQLRAMGAKL